MPEIVVRPPRAGDGADLAAVHLDTCRYYHQLDPDAFQLAEADGLADWFEAWARRDPEPRTLRLVAAIARAVVIVFRKRLD